MMGALCDKKNRIIPVLFGLYSHTRILQHMTPKFIVEQKITALVNRYAIYHVDEQGAKGELFAFAQQKRVALKEKITFYTTKDKSQVLCTLRAEKVMDVHGKFLIEDADGTELGAFKKVFKESLLVSTWQILKGDDVQFTVAETSRAMAITRRFVGFLPFVGEFVDAAFALIKYHFTAIDTNGVVQGSYEKTTRFRDHYVLSVTNDAYDSQDPRVWAALGVVLDALQAR